MMLKKRKALSPWKNWRTRGGLYLLLLLSENKALSYKSIELHCSEHHVFCVKIV